MGNFSNKQPRSDDQMRLPFTQQSADSVDRRAPVSPESQSTGWSAPLTPAVPPRPKTLPVSCNSLSESLHARAPESDRHLHRSSIFECTASEIEGGRAAEHTRELRSLINGEMLDSAMAARRHKLDSASHAVHAGVRLLLAIDERTPANRQDDGLSVASIIARHRDLLRGMTDRGTPSALTLAFDAYLRAPKDATTSEQRVSELLVGRYVERVKDILRNY